MYIGQPEIEREAGCSILRARVSFARPTRQEFPEALWFSVPESFGHLLQRAFEPFAVTLSSLASARGEEIAFDGALSERLSVGLAEYWRILSTWDRAKFNQITIKATSLASGTPASEGVAAAAFSGGVDSFFTQFLNSDRPPSFKTKYAVFIHGFDIPLAEAKIFDEAASAYEAALRTDGVELVRVKTNARAFIPPGFWEMGHGSGLAGTALALSSGVNRFFIPSSKSYGTLEPWGSDPLTDGLLSTERMHIIHDGAFYSRFDKINLMKDWDPFRRLLRTCYKRPAAFENCGECHNCRRTMMVLASLGVLDRFPTFPAVSNPYHFINCRWETPHERLFGSQAIAHSIKVRKLGLACAGMAAMQTSRLKGLVKQPKALSRRIRRALRGGRDATGQKAAT